MSTTTGIQLPTIEDAVDIAHHVVWGVMTTVDAKGRPRNRIVHPVWQLDGAGLRGWLTTRRTPLKMRHLAANAYVSIAYVAANTDFAYFDCVAEWVNDDAGKRMCWKAFLNAEGPVRYDPASIWPEGPVAESLAVLRFAPYRVQAGRAERIRLGERASLARLG